MVSRRKCPSAIRACLKCGRTDRGPIANTGLCSECSGVRHGKVGGIRTWGAPQRESESLPIGEAWNPTPAPKPVHTGPDPRPVAETAPPKHEYHLRNRDYAGRVLRHEGFH